MIDIELLRNNKTRAHVIVALVKRGVSEATIGMFLDNDTALREFQTALEKFRAEKNTAGKKIAAANQEERAQLIEAMKAQEATEQELEKNYANMQKTVTEAWAKIPNIPLDDVQAGGEKDSVEIATGKTPVPDAVQTPKDYMTLMGSRIDMERGAKVAGARFTYISGDLARLQTGIISYVIDHLLNEGFTQVIPPLLLQEKAMAGMGYLAHEGDEVYKTQDESYLVGTSEQSLGAMHMNELLAEQDLPKRYVAYSPCFRREAGSHGKDVKGILRLHQFDKVEMFSITTPEKSEKEHQFLLQQEMVIMDSLELPYRVVRLAAGDLGAPSAKTYDIETWIPSQQTYRETHSTSNTTDYQSRRLNIRYKNTENKTQKVHMLNGTAVALPRLLIALIENHQQSDGSIAIPKCLHPYVPFTRLGSLS